MKRTGVGEGGWGGRGGWGSVPGQPLCLHRRPIRPLPHHPQVGIARTLATPADVLAAQELAASPATAPGSYLLADAAASDWAIIPAENLVAAVAAARRARAGPRLLVRAHTAAAALALLGALEAGPDGVVLATQDSTEVRALATALARARVDTASRLVYDRARVTRVASAGMGDRRGMEWGNVGGLPSRTPPPRQPLTTPPHPTSHTPLSGFASI